MENVLNLSDGWEAVVNDPGKRERVDAFHAKRRAARKEKMAVKAMIAGMLALCFLFLGLTGALTAWIAATVVQICVTYCFYMCGRAQEAKR